MVENLEQIADKVIETDVLSLEMTTGQTNYSLK